jgi:hypothetical protein
MTSKTKSDLTDRIAHYQAQGYGRQKAIGKAYSEKKKKKPASKSKPGNKYKPALNDELIFDDDTGNYLNKDIIDAVKGEQKARRRHMKNLAAEHGMTPREFFRKYPDKDTYQRKKEIQKNKNRSDAGTEMKYGGELPEYSKGGWAFSGSMNTGKMSSVDKSKLATEKGKGLSGKDAKKAKEATGFLSDVAGLFGSDEKKQKQGGNAAQQKAQKLTQKNKEKNSNGAEVVDTVNKMATNAPGPSGTYATAGQTAGSIADSIDAKNGRSDTGQAVEGGLKGAGTGAAIGSAIAPGIGTAIGAGVGATAGVITADKPSNTFSWSEEDVKRNERLTQQGERARNAKEADTGNEGATFFKKGGDLEQYMMPEAKAGGRIDKVSDDVKKYKGQSHEEGGIKVDINKDPQADIEVEGGEVQYDGKIFSDAIQVAGKKKQTVADKATDIGKKINEYEKIAEDHPHDNERQNTVAIMTKRLNQDLIKLFAYQEMKKRKNLTSDGQLQDGRSPETRNAGKAPAKQPTAASPRAKTTAPKPSPSGQPTG